MKNSRGWFNESTRHSLASYGVQTTVQGQSKLDEYREGYEVPPKELYEDINWDNPHNLEKMVKLFWWCNIHNSYEWFNFEKAFNTVKNILKKRLAKHFRLPNDEQKDWLFNQLYLERTHHLINHHIKARLSQNEINKIYDRLNKAWKEEQIKYGDEIFELRESLEMNGHKYWYEIDSLGTIVEDFNLKEELVDILVDEMYIFHDNVFDRIREVYDKLEKEEYHPDKVTFFDEVIDLYHHTGGVFEDYVNIENARQDFEEEYV